MNVKVENLEKSTAKITVEVPAEQFEVAIVGAFNKNKNRFNIPGFRRGKAPMAMIEKMYGPSIFYEDAVNTILDSTYPDAAKESGLDITSRPEINIEKIEKGQPLIYTALVAVKPPVELGQYKGVKVEKASTTVTEKDVEAELKRVQEQNARIVSIEDDSREIKKDDIAVIDFEGFVDGKSFEGGKGVDYSLTIGSHSFIDNFEDQLIGHKAGDELDVNVTFPTPYQAKELEGKPAVFKVKIKEIKVKEIPALDDEFASEVSEFETLKEYKASVKADLKSRKEREAAQINENNVVKTVVDAATIEIPQQMIDTRVDEIINDYAYRIQSSGLKLETYLQYLGQNMEEFKKSLEPEAVSNIRTRLVLEEVIKRENIQASEEAVDKKIEEMAKEYKMEPDKVREIMAGQIKSIRDQIEAQEAIDLLVAEAELVAPQKKSKAKKSEAAEEKQEDKTEEKAAEKTE